MQMAGVSARPFSSFIIIQHGSFVIHAAKELNGLALTPAICIVWKKPQVPHTARQVACHSLNNSRGKRSSIPPQNSRPDSPEPTLQGPCDPSQIRLQEVRSRTLRFLPQLEMRPSSIAPNPVESREGPPNSRVSLTSQRHTEKLPEATGTSHQVDLEKIKTTPQPKTISLSAKERNPFVWLKAHFLF